MKNAFLITFLVLVSCLLIAETVTPVVNNDVIVLMQQILQAFGTYGFKWTALGAIAAILIGYLFRKPIFKAFIIANRVYIRPVITELLEIMDETDKNKSITSGIRKAVEVDEVYDSRLKDTNNKVITKKSTKFLDYLGGPAFVVKEILFPAIKMFRR